MEYVEELSTDYTDRKDLTCRSLQVFNLCNLCNLWTNSHSCLMCSR
jgi:hypothetical protein